MKARDLPLIAPGAAASPQTDGAAASPMKAKRASLTKNERAAMIQRQGGLCFTFGCIGKPVIAEHFTPVAMGNDQKPDCLLCKPCAVAKTKRDIKAIAKVKRIRRGPRKAKRAIASRGFDKTHSKKFDGTVVRK